MCCARGCDSCVFDSIRLLHCVPQSVVAGSESLDLLQSDDEFNVEVTVTRMPEAEPRFLFVKKDGLGVHTRPLLMRDHGTRGLLCHLWYMISHEPYRVSVLCSRVIIQRMKADNRMGI